jgi:hypothetical protein
MMDSVKHREEVIQMSEEDKASPEEPVAAAEETAGVDERETEHEQQPFSPHSRKLRSEDPHIHKLHGGMGHSKHGPSVRVVRSSGKKRR